MFFHQNIDVNMTFRYSLIKIDHEIDEKPLHFDIKRHSSKSERIFGSNTFPLFVEDRNRQKSNIKLIVPYDAKIV
jgi:hypothetical protein